MCKLLYNMHLTDVSPVCLALCHLCQKVIKTSMWFMHHSLIGFNVLKELHA